MLNFKRKQAIQDNFESQTMFIIKFPRWNSPNKNLLKFHVEQDKCAKSLGDQNVQQMLVLNIRVMHIVLVVVIYIFYLFLTLSIYTKQNKDNGCKHMPECYICFFNLKLCCCWKRIKNAYVITDD